MLNFIKDNWKTVLDACAYIVLGASILCALLAPRTKTGADDKLAKLLVRVHAFLSKLALNPKV